jgi:hypothetical protein
MQNNKGRGRTPHYNTVDSTGGKASPGRASAEKRQNKTVGISELLGLCLDQVVPDWQQQRYYLRDAWEKIATPAAQDHTDNIVFSKRGKEPVVLVYTDDSAWMAELNNQKEYFRVMLEAELKTPVHEVKFLVSRTTYLRKRRP